MSEWWTYSLSDFLLFSSRTYYRLFELHNAALWPAHLVTMAGGLALLAVTARHRPHAARIVVALLAIAWAWVAWAFHLQRFAQINWVAPAFAVAFAAQALLLAGAGAMGRPVPSMTVSPSQRLGLVLAGAAVAAYPLLAILAGRPMSTAETFGIAPDPTALATIGFLVAMPVARRSKLVLLAIPLAWCAVSGATLYTMDAQYWWLLPVCATAALSGVVRER